MALGPGQIPCWVLTGSSQGLAVLSTSVLLSRSGRQTTAGRVKRWLPALCSKTIISSCFPTTCQEWFIATGTWTGWGRHQWSQSLLPKHAALFPNSLDELCSAGGGQFTLGGCVCVTLLCLSESDCQNVPWMGVCQLSLGYTLKYSMFKQWRVAR